MSRWFRVYDDLVDDPKVQRLPPETFRGLINLWCLASKNGGILPPHDEIAFKLRLSGPKATKLLDDLVTAGLLDHDETGVHPHNWNGRQHKSDVSNERVKRFRERHKKQQCNALQAVTVAPPETEAETEHQKASASGVESAPRHPPKVSRIPVDWSPSEDDLAFARQEGLTDERATREASKFRDHWLAASGSSASKRDWPAAWRNWARKAAEGFGSPRQNGPSGNGQSNGSRLGAYQRAAASFPNQDDLPEYRPGVRGH